MLDWTKINIPVLTPTIIQKEKNSVLIKVVNTTPRFIDFYEKIKIQESFIEDFIIAVNLSPEIQNLESLRSADKDVISKTLSSLRTELKSISLIEPDYRKAGLARQLYVAYDSEHTFRESTSSSSIAFFSPADMLLDKTLEEFATRMSVVIQAIEYLKVRLNPKLFRGNIKEHIMAVVSNMDERAIYNDTDDLEERLDFIDRSQELSSLICPDGHDIKYSFLLQALAGVSSIKNNAQFARQFATLLHIPPLDDHNLSLNYNKRSQKIKDVLG